MTDHPMLWEMKTGGLVIWAVFKLTLIFQWSQWHEQSPDWNEQFLKHLSDLCSFTTFNFIFNVQIVVK